MEEALIAYYTAPNTFPELRAAVLEGLVSSSYVERTLLKRDEMRFRDRGNESETPEAYLGRKLTVHRRISPLPVRPTAADHALEVAMLWAHVPNAWHAHVSADGAATAHQLWRLVKDRFESLMASTTL